MHEAFREGFEKAALSEGKIMRAILHRARTNYPHTTEAIIRDTSGTSAAHGMKALTNDRPVAVGTAKHKDLLAGLRDARAGDPSFSPLLWGGSSANNDRMGSVVTRLLTKQK